MKRRKLQSFTLSILLLLAVVACGDSGGGGAGGSGAGTIGGVGTTSITYVTNSGSNDVSGYTINSTSGALSPIAGSPFTQITNPTAIAVSSNGFFAFVANGSSNTVTAFRVATNGALLSVPGTLANPNPASVGTEPASLAISPDTQFLYVASRGSNTVTAFTIGDNALLTLVPQAGANTNPISVRGTAPEALAISPNGRFLYVANSGSNNVSAFQIGAGGLLTPVPATASNPNPVTVGGTTPIGIAILPSGQFLYVANSGSSNVTAFQIGADGLLTLVPGGAASLNPISVESTAPNGIIISSNGPALYTANGGGNVTAFTIGADGLLTLMPVSGGSPNPVPAGTSPAGITLSPDGKFLYAANGGGTVSAYTIATATGSLVPLNPLIGNPFRAGTSPSSIATPGHP